MSHKGSRSRITDHQAARDAWERVWGKKAIAHAFREDKRKSELTELEKQWMQRALNSFAHEPPQACVLSEANDKQYQKRP